VLGMMELKEFPTFKQHVRDFLVQASPAAPLRWLPSVTLLAVVAGEWCAACTSDFLQCASKARLVCLPPTCTSTFVLFLQSNQFADQNNADLFTEEVAAQVGLDGWHGRAFGFAVFARAPSAARTGCGQAEAGKAARVAKAAASRGCWRLWTGKC